MRALLACLATLFLGCRILGVETALTAPRLEVAGVYRIEPSAQAVHDALEVQGSEDYVRRELGSLVLVELSVHAADHRFDVGQLKQPHTDYVPYDESFLDVETGLPIEDPGRRLGYSILEDRQTRRLMKRVRKTGAIEPASEEEIERYRLPGRRDFGLVFFLHFFDAAQPLETPYGPLLLPQASELPERLRWKKYVYWD